MGWRIYTFFIFTFLIILFFLFVIGLPTNFNEEVIDKKIEKNSYLFTCEINQIFIEFDEILNYKNCDIENKNNFTNKKFNNLSLYYYESFKENIDWYQPIFKTINFSLNYE